MRAVFSARRPPRAPPQCLETGQKVAIKKVLQDRRFKNRELDIMRMVSHPNIVRLLHCFFTYDRRVLNILRVGSLLDEKICHPRTATPLSTLHSTPREQDVSRPFQLCQESNPFCSPRLPRRDDMYLNLVLEYVPDTVYRLSKQYAKRGQRMPAEEVRMYVYQICRALHSIHQQGICHRDIKPQNLLVDSESHDLKLCDFGSAKQLRRGEPNISYICSRYYRAPELIFGATDYTTKIDMWSVGCVMAELFLGMPLVR